MNFRKLDNQPGFSVLGGIRYSTSIHSGMTYNEYVTAKNIGLADLEHALLYRS